MLALLDVARSPRELSLPGYRLHRLHGDRAGFWSIAVSRNWRIVFRMDGDDVTDLDLVDYH
jgi:proteic killer suppression protein